jgi:signal transduction histidine kinase
LINLGIFVGASGASYFLAKRTLRPIENALEEQRRFTADASHELRTPLAAMKTEIEVGLPTADPQEHPRVLRRNLEEIEKLDRLSTGLLTLARHESSAGNLTVAPVEFATVTAEAARRVAAKAKIKNITFKNEHVAGPVKGDYGSLVDLLVIILDNAIKYSPAKSEIGVHGQWTRSQLTLSVTDHGIGIAPADLPHVFRRFYRTDTARTKTGSNGFGLGLAIAKQIVERHHGSISISSTVNHGTTVTLVIPRA